jgi:UDP-glucose 4-epimerase
MGPISNLKGKRVLVTGASGFVGRHVLAQGLVAGVEVHGLSRTKRQSEGVQWWQGDLLDVDSIGQIISRIRPEGILHMAADGVAYGAAYSRDVLRTNVEGLANLLDSVKAADITPHVVIAGSGFEYAPQDRPLAEDDLVRPNSIYGISKAAATQLAGIFAGSFPITVLRFFSLYGPGEQEPRVVPYVIAQARRGLPIELTPGEQMRDYTYVKDAAEGFWRSIAATAPSKECRILNLASGTRITLRAFLELLGRLLLEHGMTVDLRFGARPYRSDELMNYTADIKKLRKELGWTPQTSLEDGLSETIKQNLLLAG